MTDSSTLMVPAGRLMDLVERNFGERGVAAIKSGIEFVDVACTTAGYVKKDPSAMNTVSLTPNTTDIGTLAREVCQAMAGGNMQPLIQAVMRSLTSDTLPDLARAVAGQLGMSESSSLQRGLALISCSYLLAPRTVAQILGGDRDRYIPELDQAPSAILNNLAAQATSTPLVLSSSDDDGVPRVFMFDEITLDTGTSFNSLVMNVLVGGRRQYRFSGSQLNPSTENACVTRALCGTYVCIGALQDLSITFTNVSGAALGASASVRVHGRLAFPGDKDFVGCWGPDCDKSGLSGMIQAACSCERKAA